VSCWHLGEENGARFASSGLHRHSSSVTQGYCKTYCEKSFVKPSGGSLPRPRLSLPVHSKFLFNSTELALRKVFSLSYYSPPSSCWAFCWPIAEGRAAPSWPKLSWLLLTCDTQNTTGTPPHPGLISPDKPGCTSERSEPGFHPLSFAFQTQIR